MQFYTVEDRVLDAYILHKRTCVKDCECYDIPKSVLSKKLSVYIANARKTTIYKDNPCMSAHYFSNLVIHTDDITRKIFYIKFSGDRVGYHVNHTKVRNELKALGINRRGDNYKKDYLEGKLL